MASSKRWTGCYGNGEIKLSKGVSLFPSSSYFFLPFASSQFPYWSIPQITVTLTQESLFLGYLTLDNYLLSSKSNRNLLIL